MYPHNLDELKRSLRVNKEPKNSRVLNLRIPPLRESDNTLFNYKKSPQDKSTLRKTVKIQQPPGKIMSRVSGVLIDRKNHD
ncbi:Uncharacterised protein [Legionella quateirensis]|uniref:Uncharacterized protein n=1 Tax=Legionella quateirensis TaxID=45072 RepID=A0A378KVD2_9GAMM|nr:Uncharacterised protein [Legionella quateirensis]